MQLKLHLKLSLLRKYFRDIAISQTLTPLVVYDV